jgi:hypothetical protein
MEEIMARAARDKDNGFITNSSINAGSDGRSFKKNGKSLVTKNQGAPQNPAPCGQPAG